MSIAQRIVFVLAALLGGSGVAAAPALLALTLLATTNLLRIATLTLAGGATLFCADLAARHLFGGGLFPFSAPLGGMAMIAGWVLVGVGGLLMPRS